jgi:SAM-dependent methyltransferase
VTADALFRLHEGLPRQGPGSDACTREALRRLPPLPPQPRIADLGCGSGKPSLVLAEALGSRVIAIDIYQPYLDQLTEAAARRGLGHLIEARQADMAAPGLAPGSLDLLWSEGAIFVLGFAEGLALWRPLLASRGLAAITECTWLSDERPGEAVRFFEAAYPAMGSVADNVARAEAAGFEVLDHFTLPPAAWWDEYYTPLLARLDALAPEADPALRAEIEATRREIDVYRAHGASYGYVFYLLRRTD